MYLDSALDVYGINTFVTAMRFEVLVTIALHPSIQDFIHSYNSTVGFISYSVVLTEERNRFYEGGTNRIHQCDVVSEINEFCDKTDSTRSEVRFEE